MNEILFWVVLILFCFVIGFLARYVTDAMGRWRG